MVIQTTGSVVAGRGHTSVPHGKIIIRPIFIEDVCPEPEAMRADVRRQLGLALAFPFPFQGEDCY